MIDKDTLLAPHHLGREEEPREPIKEDYWEDLEEVLVGIPKMETLYAEDMVKYEQALSAHKAEYDKPVMDLLPFNTSKMSFGKEYYFVTESNIYTGSAICTNISGEMEVWCNEMSLDESCIISFCDKKEHDDKVSKWKLRQRLYEGFELIGNTLYSNFKGVQVTFNPNRSVQVLADEYILCAKKGGITLHQFEAITGLKSIEL